MPSLEPRLFDTLAEVRPRRIRGECNVQDESLIDLATDAIFAHVQAERELAERFPDATWTFNPAHAAVTAHLGETSHDFPAQFIATIDQTAGMWTWAWQEAIGVSDAVLQLARRVREVGEKRAIAPLTTPQVQLHETASLSLQLAAQSLSDASHWLRIETEPGKLAVLSVAAGELELPDANALVDIVMSGVALQISDRHRAAFEAYLKQLDASSETFDENGMRVSVANGTVIATFDAEGRILSINREQDAVDQRSARESTERMVAEFELDDESPFGPSPFVFASTPINAPQLDEPAENDADEPAFTATDIFGVVDSQPAVANPTATPPAPPAAPPSAPEPVSPPSAPAPVNQPAMPGLPELPPLPPHPASVQQRPPQQPHQQGPPQQSAPGQQRPPQQFFQPPGQQPGPQQFDQPQQQWSQPRPPAPFQPAPGQPGQSGVFPAALSQPAPGQQPWPPQQPQQQASGQQTPGQQVPGPQQRFNQPYPPQQPPRQASWPPQQAGTQQQTPWPQQQAGHQQRAPWAQLQPGPQQQAGPQQQSGQQQQAGPQQQPGQARPQPQNPYGPFGQQPPPPYQPH